MRFSNNNSRRALAESPSRRRPRASRFGAVTVEFALTAPLFFLLLFGAAEFLRIATIRHDLQMFAYEAATLAATPVAQQNSATAAASTTRSPCLRGVRGATSSKRMRVWQISPIRCSRAA